MLRHVLVALLLVGCGERPAPIPPKITIDRNHYQVYTKSWCEGTEHSCYINYHGIAWKVGPGGETTADLTFKRGNIVRGEFTPLWIFQSDESGDYLVATDEDGYAVIIHMPLPDEPTVVVGGAPFGGIAYDGVKSDNDEPVSGSMALTTGEYGDALPAIVDYSGPREYCQQLSGTALAVRYSGLGSTEDEWPSLQVICCTPIGLIRQNFRPGHSDEDLSEVIGKSCIPVDDREVIGSIVLHDRCDDNVLVAVLDYEVFGSSQENPPSILIENGFPICHTGARSQLYIDNRPMVDSSLATSMDYIWPNTYLVH